MRFNRSDVWLLIAALAGGTLFFSSVHHLWPLADTNVNEPPVQVIAQARAFLRAHGIDDRGAAAASSLRLDSDILDYLMRKFGMRTTQDLIRAGHTIYVYKAELKRPGDPDSMYVIVHPERGVTAWGRGVQEDAPGAVLPMDVARQRAMRAVDLRGFRETGHLERDRPSRRDHVFTYERYLSGGPTSVGRRASCKDRL